MGPVTPAWDKVYPSSHSAKKYINKWEKHRINSWSQLLCLGHISKGSDCDCTTCKLGLLEAGHSPTSRISAPSTLVFTMLGSLIVAQPYHIMLSRCLAEHLELWGRGKAGGMDEGHLPLCPKQPSGKVLEKGVCQSEETTLANV